MRFLSSLFLVACAVVALPATAQQQQHELVIENHEKVPILRLFAATSDADDWGGNVLTVPVLRPGEKTTLQWNGDCVWDLRVVFPGAAEERRDVDLCSLGVLDIQPGWTTFPIGPRESL
jgi:hypothetical protein